MKLVTQRFNTIQFLSKVFSTVTKSVPFKIKAVEQEHDDLSSSTVIFFVRGCKGLFDILISNHFSFENSKFINQNHIFGVIFPQLDKSDIHSMVQDIVFTYEINMFKKSLFNYNL